MLMSADAPKVPAVPISEDFDEGEKSHVREISRVRTIVDDTLDSYDRGGRPDRSQDFSKTSVENLAHAVKERLDGWESQSMLKTQITVGSDPERARIVEGVLNECKRKVNASKIHAFEMSPDEKGNLVYTVYYDQAGNKKIKR